MNKILQIFGVILAAAVLSSAAPALADNNPNAYISIGGAAVYTNSYTNLSATGATLQGNLSIPYITNSNYVWFQWGQTTNYGNETTHQFLASGGAFNQQIMGLAPNTTYHFRAVAQPQNGTTIYGQDSSFYTASNSGVLTISKKVINLTTNNLNWSEYQSAKPGDVLSFAIVLQASGQDVYNVTLSDTLPQNIFYKGDLIVNSQLNYPGNIFSGINIGTIRAGEAAIISYRVQIADSTIIPYGTTTLTSTAAISGSGVNYQTAAASVVITNTQTAGASTGPTTISTGLTNNFFTDSFFLPLLIIILGLWLCFSGKVYSFADWLKNR
jgi:uncharacterized repeat protein (TIGR01451 family)